MMLHDQDSKMVLMNPLKPHSLFSMDIEVGKVIEEWKVDDKKSKIVSLLFSIYTAKPVFTISFQSPYYANYVSRCLTM